MRAHVFIALFATLATTGCESRYVVTPPSHSIEIPRVRQTMPHSIALVSKNLGDLAEIKEGLNESHLFNFIHYPSLIENSADGTLAINLNYDSTDENFLWLFLKCEFNGFTLGLFDSYIDFETKHAYECTADFCKNGKVLKTYNAYGSSIISRSHISRGMGDAEAKASASKTLQVNLIQQLIEDRSFIERTLGSTPALNPLE